MRLEPLVILALVLALVPVALFSWNLFLVCAPGSARRDESRGGQELISVLIPARNEVLRIGAALESILANRGVALEVIVLDDHSTDGTDVIVRNEAARDDRVRLERAPALPAGWCGKQHACHVLAGRARGQWLVFMDADVRLAPDALKRMVGFMRESGCSLASGVPRQLTGTFMERLLIPLVHFVLLGFLPVWRMRRCTKPAYAAGCGQLFIAEARSYRQVGGHAEIRLTLHDGIKLPRLFRRHGLRTDLFDATDVAACRMYERAGEVVQGLIKNAHEALASRIMILPMTLVLFGGQVLPWLLLSTWPVLTVEGRWMSLAAAGLTLLPRLLAAWRFRQSWRSALLHPVGIMVFLALQWIAFVRNLLGRPTAWRGRDYSARTEEESRTHPIGVTRLKRRLVT